MGINEIQLHGRESQGSSPKKTMIHHCLVLMNIHMSVHMSVFIKTVLKAP